MNRSKIYQNLHSKGVTDLQLQETALACLLDGVDLPTKAYQILYDHFMSTQEMPYGVAKARDGDPYAWISKTLEQEFSMQGWL